MRNRVYPILLLFAIMLLVILSGCASDSKSNPSLRNHEESSNNNAAAPLSDEDNNAKDQENALDNTEGNLSLYLPVDGIEQIELATPETGNGELPVFKWEAVEGASLYMVIVHRQDGKAYWAWEGSENEVILGNIQDQNTINSGGPRLLEPMTWAVVALDKDDKFIASSILQRISP